MAPALANLLSVWQRTTALAALVLIAAGVTADPGRAAPVSVTQTAFEASDCDRRVYESALNGVDARIIDATPFAGRTVRLVSSASSLSYTIYDASCEIAHSGSGYTVRMPMNAAWLVVERETFVVVE